jgi:hypothetical protein
MNFRANARGALGSERFVDLLQNDPAATWPKNAPRIPLAALSANSVLNKRVADYTSTSQNDSFR